jgi:hypothetical protein
MIITTYHIREQGRVRSTTDTADAEAAARDGAHVTASTNRL